MAKQLYILAHDVARQRAIDAVKNAPAGFSVTVSEPKRNLDQNALLHAALTDVANQCEWAGQRWSVEEWKRLLTAAWCRASKDSGGVQVVPAVDGKGFDVLYQRTSNLSKRECSELCEYIFAWGAERGVQWSNELEAA